MRRVVVWACAALLLTSAYSRPLCGAEPLKVADEMSKIDAEFNATIRDGGNTAANSRKAFADRNAALGKLVKQAEESKSQEHAALARAYQMLSRWDDAVREARAALADKATPSAYAMYNIVVTSLTQSGKMDEAEKAFAEALRSTGDNPNLGSLRSTLAFGYLRANQNEKAIEHLGEYLEGLRPSLVQRPAMVAQNFQQQVNQLASAAMRAKSEKGSAILAKLHQQLAAEKDDDKKLEPVLAALRSAQIRVLVAAEKLEAAAKIADEQLAAAEKKLAADPKDAAALLAILSAKQLQVQAAGQGENAGKFADDLNQFIDQNLDGMSDSAEFISAASNTLSTRAYRLMSSGKLEEAQNVLNDWKTRLAGLKAENPAAKGAVANAMRGVATILGRLEGELKRAALVGQPYFPIEEATWLNGSPLKPEELRGKAILLDFWAVWCGPCIATFPHLKQWHEEYGDKGLVIIGVTNRYGYDWDADAKRPKNVDELAPEKEDAATMKFVEHHGLRHRIAVMSERSLSAKYLVSGIPQAVLIDRQGLIRLIKVGSGDANAQAMEAAIRQALDLPVAKAGE
jgi:pentatricopeptide repeat protein